MSVTFRKEVLVDYVDDCEISLKIQVTALCFVKLFVHLVFTLLFVNLLLFSLNIKPTGCPMKQDS